MPHEMDGLEPPVVGRMLGEGEMPSELMRFNWGAFWLPQFWGFAYGTWSLVGLWLLGASVAIFAAGAVPSSGQRVLSALILGTCITSVVEAVIRLWAGMRANRLAWRRQARLLAMAGTAAKRIPLATYLKRQRTWGMIGLIVVVGSSALVLPEVRNSWSEFGAGDVGVALGVAWIAVEGVAGIWLAGKARAEVDSAPL